MSAIFGFTFHIGRMTEVLTPDIYRAHCVQIGRDGACIDMRGLKLTSKLAVMACWEPETDVQTLHSP